MGTRPAMLLAAIVLATGSLEAQAQYGPGAPVYAYPQQYWQQPPGYGAPGWVTPAAYAVPGYAVPAGVAAEPAESSEVAAAHTAAGAAAVASSNVSDGAGPDYLLSGCDRCGPACDGRGGAGRHGGKRRLLGACDRYGDDCGEPCCDDCCEDCCDDCYEPGDDGCCDRCFSHRWHPFAEFQATTSYLKLDSLDDISLITNAAGQDLANAGDFRFDHELSIDGGGVYHLTPCWGVEGRYLRLENVEDTNQLLAVPATATLGTTPPGVLGIAATSIDLSFESFLQSAELGLSRALLGYPNVRFLAQFRYLEVNQQLAMDFLFPGQVTNFNWRTQNDLYGGQIGLVGHVQHPCHRLAVDGFLKAGLYYNDAQGDFLATNTILGTRTATDDNSGDHPWAFVGEAALYLSYDVTRHVRVRGGYHVLIFDGVAVATDQVPATAITVFTAAVNLNDNGGLFFHGPSVSAVATW